MNKPEIISKNKKQISKIAIIPARCGSKRIPRKNIKDFLGKPIIAYSIDAAIKSELFDDVMVSTDDLEIANIAKKYGANIPFMRSGKNSDDFASTSDVLLEVIDEYQKYNKSFEYCCCIYPAAPFISSNLLIESYKKLYNGRFDSLIPVVKFGYPIHRALRIKNNYLEFIYPENIKKRSQDLETSYHDAGMFYWFKTEKFLKEKDLFSNNSTYVDIPESQCQDIDNDEDWKLAEMKYNKMNN